MTNRNFAAFVVRESPAGGFVSSVEERPLESLPEGEVLVRVRYSSLNYKDALSAVGNRGVTKRYPHTPGIDAAGMVEESTASRFRTGDEVIVTGRDLGMNTSGGFAEFIRVPADWVLHLPGGLTLRESMMYGTAGFTAAQSVLKLEEHGTRPDGGDVLVTGATGGVGSVAVGILAKIGFSVTAATGKPEAAAFLERLGATAILGRDEILAEGEKPLLRARWNAAVDTVGGEFLSVALKATQYRGAVTCCGMVAGTDFSSSIFPFILRGVTLYGIDSAECPMGPRREIWARLADRWKPKHLEDGVTECALGDLGGRIEDMLAGRHRGRTVVRIP